VSHKNMSTKYIYAWRNNSKRKTLYKRQCHVLAYLKMNSVLVEFEDGNKEVISRHALRIWPIGRVSEC